MNQRNFILSMCGFIICGIGTSTGLTCNSCYHHVFTSHDSSITGLLDLLSSYDSHCLAGEGEYDPLWEVRDCTTSCVTEIGTASLTYSGIPVDYTIAQRGCSDDYRHGDCWDLTVDNLVSDDGFRVVSENVKGCYCGYNYCNQGCECPDPTTTTAKTRTQNAATLETGSAMFTVCAVLVTVLLQ